MLHDTIQAIRADLHSVEQEQERLCMATHFIPRAQALDVLTFHILERIENVQYVHGYHQELAALYQQATRLWQRLEAVNDQLFRCLRAQLVASPAMGPALQHLIETYVGHDAPAPVWEDFDADYLDVFLNGVLGIDHVPEATQDLQAGMIGYHPTPARVILTLIEHAHLSASDVFYDLGAGLGRVVLLVGLLTAARARGIEVEPAYCAYAQQRAANLHLSQAVFLNVDARKADYTDGTVFFLYTPFTGRLLQEVLARLRTEALSRPLTIATYGACARDVEREPWLQPTVQQKFTYDTLTLFTSR